MSLVAFLSPQAGPVQGPQPRYQTPVNQINQAEPAAAANHAGGATTVVVAAGAASAFLVGGRAKRKGLEAARGSVAAVKAFESELGVQAPVGFWDPLGLSADGDAATFTRRRETELKHGRVSMLATMGYITPELVGKWPAYLSPSSGLKFSDVPNGLGALSKVPLAGWVQILIYCAMVEVSGIQNRLSDAPGDFGWKVLTSDDPEAKTKKLSAEIANGRLAMMAIIGMFFQDGLTGSAWGDWASYTDSPLRAVEAPDLSSELGACPPLGFWDPLDLSKFDDPVIATTQFKRRRVIELQHGRVSMLACIGYIVPEYFKWPGYCAPSLDLKFEDIPNGLEAVDKIPGIGWVQILTFVGLIEVFNLQSEPKEYPGDYELFGAFGIPGGGSIDDKEKKEKSLLAEINNGRLAMMAIIGMFFQNGLTGSAWGDWANYTDSPMRAFESELGVQEPVGFWDPLGLSADGDSATFLRRRESEIKHGRISMLATMGYITPELTGKFPGVLSKSEGVSFADIPNGLGAIAKVPALGWGQIVLYCAAVEGAGANNRGDGPGEFGWKVLTSSDPEEKRKKLSAEIANGRLAMMAIIGMFFQDGLTGSAWGDWANYTGSPLRAFENELGVQAPVGFWDPLGLTKDGDVESFKRRRATELKHGRVSMIACLGYITPVYAKFPGYCSPSQNVEFDTIPNGLSAVSKVPAVGWLQIFIFCGLIEKGLFVHDPTRPPGDFENGGVLGVPNGSTLPAGEGRNRKLNAEIANGRLAMMAIIGMFYQDGLTGSAWGDWDLYTDSPLRAFEFELGSQAPLGFWDPLGLSADGDEQKFKRRRAIEFKHGRVSMLATLGYIVPEYTKWPGYLSPSQNLKFTDVPNGLAAISKVPTLGWVQILCFAGFIEGKDGLRWDNENPGDIGWKVLSDLDPERKAKRLAIDLSNGRLAMFAIMGMFFQDGLTGSAWGDWDLYTTSPVRAFENELGVQSPFGFWDPLGLAADGNVERFKRRRETEIKHGRIAMLATMGYMTPEISGKFGGYLSPSENVMFEDIPNGLGALSKVPLAGWIQIFLYCAFCEGSAIRTRTDEPGNLGFKPPLGMTSDDPVVRQTKLASELANGRLAMFAIMGMFFQDGLTGSAWGDWSNYFDTTSL